jgi:hypothetical protein
MKRFTKEQVMKIELLTKTALCAGLLLAGCAVAQESTDTDTDADADATLTVTDTRGQVLMTNATYHCTYGGKLFFAEGCSVKGFPARKLSPELLAQLDIDLNDVEESGREDVRNKMVSDRAYQQSMQNFVAARAVAGEQATRRAEAAATVAEARRAEAELALRETARRDYADHECQNIAVANSTAVQFSESPVLYPAPGPRPHPHHRPHFPRIRRHPAPHGFDNGSTRPGGSFAPARKTPAFVAPRHAPQTRVQRPTPAVNRTRGSLAGFGH